MSCKFIILAALLALAVSQQTGTCAKKNDSRTGCLTEENCCYFTIRYIKGANSTDNSTDGNSSNTSAKPPAADTLVTEPNCAHITDLNNFYKQLDPQMPVQGTTGFCPYLAQQFAFSADSGELNNTLVDCACYQTYIGNGATSLQVLISLVLSAFTALIFAQTPVYNSGNTDTPAFFFFLY
eukprot:TRINITY_DN2516_c0_g3_i1.p1 TRINITY_DN2516_c0_g3~~TRINITY_DN2516_c0_g3_i1.p1  ORF type:complete len:181 (+),score=54.87 TRINITY_DN2516_c0_g3_i1:300-842(+)